MLHILLGDAAKDTDSILGTAKNKKPLPWIVPKKARIGDRALFFLPVRGFVARGVIGSAPRTRSSGRYVASVRDISLLRTFVPLAFIRKNHRKWKWPTFPRGIATIDGPVETRLEELLHGYKRALADSHPKRATDASKASGLQKMMLREGAVLKRLVSVYVRDPDARRQCIAKYGTECFICKFSFKARYGKVADGFIHVHHLRQLSTIRKEHKVDPVKHLRPVCPNCHAVLHLINPPHNIEQVRSFLRR